MLPEFGRGRPCLDAHRGHSADDRVLDGLASSVGPVVVDGRGHDDPAAASQVGMGVRGGRTRATQEPAAVAAGVVAMHSHDMCSRRSRGRSSRGGRGLGRHRGCGRGRSGGLPLLVIVAVDVVVGLVAAAAACKLTAREELPEGLAKLVRHGVVQDGVDGAGGKEKRRFGWKLAPNNLLTGSPRAAVGNRAGDCFERERERFKEKKGCVVTMPRESLPSSGSTGEDPLHITFSHQFM